MCNCLYIKYFLIRSVNSSLGQNLLMSGLSGLASDADVYHETPPEMFNVICHNSQTIPHTDIIGMSMTSVDDELLGNEILNPCEWRSRQRADPVIGFFRKRNFRLNLFRLWKLSIFLRRLISEGCFIFHFAPLPLEVARRTMCTKEAVKHQSPSS